MQELDGSDWSFGCEVVRRGPGEATVRVLGEIDISTVGRLREALASARQTASAVTIDLRSVTFMDSSGIHALVDETAEAMFLGIRMDLEVSPAVERVIRLARCSDAFAAWNLSPVPPTAPTSMTAAPGT